MGSRLAPETSVVLVMVKTLNNTENTTASMNTQFVASITDRVVRKEPRIQLEWDDKSQSYRLGITI